jgi:pimeloyl-ACP methyl ester carboxylesterase
MGNFCGPKAEPVKNANLVLEPDKELRQKAFAMEREIIIKVGLKPEEDVFIKNIQIEYFGNNYIHTILCTRDDGVQKPNLIFIHGYQGTGVLFYKVFNDFIAHFNVYCIDMIGMGLSSRPQVEFPTPHEYIDFFINSIELWRRAVGLEKFYLIGHSLGGYFSALYTLRYPSVVEQLTLLSPAGITDFSKYQDEKIKLSRWDKVIMKVFKIFGLHKYSIQQASQNSRLMRKFVKKYIKRHIKKIPKEERRWIARLLTLIILKFPNDLNWTVFHMFERPLPIAKVPIEDELIKLQTNYTIDIYYGETDWMDKYGVTRLVQNTPQKFRMFTVPQYGHNFIIENPSHFQEHFLKNYRNRIVNNN